MFKTGNLTYLKNSEIDFEKWDQCINEAPNSRVYAASWFLERTAVTWDALVWGNYEFVLPLPVNKKFGIPYIFNPFYSQQLGIFPAPAPDMARLFYTEIVHRFSFVDVQLNAGNLPPKNFNEAQFYPRKNFLLLLNADYDTISSGFSKNTHRNIAKANNNRLSYVEGISLEDFLELKQKNLAVKLSKTIFQKLKSMIAYSQYKGFGEIVGVYSPKNNLCAAVFFLRWKDRIIYMNAVSTREGKEMRAMFLLIDQLLKSVAGKNLTLDFEGSMVPGIARFFEGFGATPETYYHMKVNRLPFPVKWLKRNF